MVEKLIISKIKDAPDVGSQTKKSESTIGVLRSEEEREKALEEWLIRKKSIEKLRIILDIILLLRVSLDHNLDLIDFINIVCA